MHIKSNIAKTVEEFVDYRIPDIIDCMEGKPEVAIHPVHPGTYTACTGRISTVIWHLLLINVMT